MAGTIFQITGLFANQHNRSSRGSFPKDGLRGPFPEITRLAIARSEPDIYQGRLQGNEIRRHRQLTSPMLEVLNGAFVSFGRFPRAESSEIPPLPRLGVPLSRIQPEFSGFQFSNHPTSVAGFLPLNLTKHATGESNPFFFELAVMVKSREDPPDRARGSACRGFSAVPPALAPGVLR
jgi:hypothetical protein